jgi:hypothetical protein
MKVTICSNLHLKTPKTRPTAPSAIPSVGRIPRVARLMALAHRFEALIRDGVVTGQADLARLGRVTRPRITQIMNLLFLAPDVQEELLFLPTIKRGRDRLKLFELLRIASEWNWDKQRKMWQRLCTANAQTNAQKNARR